MSARFATENKIRYLALTIPIASNDMSDSKVQITTNGAEHQDRMQGENTQKYIDESMNLVDKSIPINPNTGKPYFKINENAFDGEWAAGEAQHIPSSEWGSDNE